MLKFTLCYGHKEEINCPCLGEYGCNLNYTTGSMGDDAVIIPEDWETFSPDCHLEKIVFENQEFIPKRHQLPLLESTVTIEGIKRHPPKGIYKGDMGDTPDMWEVCKCQESCDRPCHGECGCEACKMAYADFLSNE